MAKIGFLGLGAMGLPMAKRLAAAGHEMRATVHRNPEPARELEKAGPGVRIAATAAEVVAGADFIVSILPEDPQIREVLLAPEVTAALKKGAILIEMSSATSAVVKLVAERYAALGVRVLDAPVSGGVSGAATGDLTVMCGGDADVIEAARPILEVVGKRIVPVGGVGAGKDMKSVNQIIGAATAAVVAEGLQLAKRLGLDLDRVYEVVSTSSGQSYNFDKRFRRMADDDYEGGFKLWLMTKDMRIALAGAGDLSMPVSSLAYELFKMAADPANDDLDFSVMSKIYPGNRAGR